MATTATMLTTSTNSTTINLLDYHIPEAIQIQVTKTIGRQVLNGIEEQRPVFYTGPNINSDNKCTFCVDPQITSLSIIQTLMVRTFDLSSEFHLSYYDWSTGIRLPIRNDGELHKAYFEASHPFLDIRLETIDYAAMSIAASSTPPDEKALMPMASTPKETSRSYQAILADWDVVTSSDVILAQTITKTNNFILQQIEKLKNKAKNFSSPNGSTTIGSINSWFLAETIFQYIMDTSNDDRPAQEPLNETTFHTFLDAEGRINSQRDLRITIYRRGVEPSLRKVIWKHLLNVYPEGYTALERIDFIKIRCETYRKMKELWQSNFYNDPEVEELANMIRKDVLRTDRQHSFYASNGLSSADDGNDYEFDNANIKALFNVLLTYALNHLHRYCQGMSDLVSPLLYVMKDEAHAYISFCALMKRLGDNFSTESVAITRKFNHLTALLQHYDLEFYNYLRLNGAHELLFSYRWLLLDLKREFDFDETLGMLEVLWASIPPESSNAAYLNLFDDGHLYIPNRSKMAADKVQHFITGKREAKPKAKEKEEEMETVRKSPKETKKRLAAVTDRLKSIKFLPNVLSSDSQNILDSPLSETSGGSGDFVEEERNRLTTTALVASVELKPWDSPNMSKACNRHLVFTSSELFDEDSEEEEAELAIEAKEGILDQMIMESINSHKQQIDDASSSCSTNDSGILSFNNSTSIRTSLKESAAADIDTTTTAAAAASAAAAADADECRQNFQAMTPAKKSLICRRRQMLSLHNAHCNGDEDEEMEGRGEDDDSITSSLFNRPHSTSIDTAESFIGSSSSSSEAAAILVRTFSMGQESEESYSSRKERRRALSTFSFARARNLLSIGKSLSVDSLSSVTSGYDGKSIESKTGVGGQHSPTDLTAPRLSIEIEMSELDESGRRKCVSNEQLDRLENMSNLNVNGRGNNDPSLSNIFSTSTSSLVILSTVSESQMAIENDRTLSTQAMLLTPDELGPSEAFMLFLCLTLLLQNRDKIIEQNMDRNDIQMFFDSMMRKHNVKTVLRDARNLFHTYLSQWHKECLHV